MARYHFQVRTASHIALSEVADLENLEDARIEAARRIGRLLSDHAMQIWVDQDWQMNVTDETGLILFTMQVMVSDASAIGKGPR